MGGLLYKGKTKPIDKSTYYRIVSDIHSIFSLFLDASQYKLKDLAFIRDKEIFNDIDFIIEYDKYYIGYDFMKKLGDIHSNFSDCVVNGNTISYIYDKQYHIDFMIVPSTHDTLFHNWKSNCLYYDYELGNFIGKIAKRFHCTLKPSGLYLNVKNYTTGKEYSHTKELYITSNVYDICKFLDYDYFTYQKGFATEKDFFDYIRSSKHFNSIFFMSNEYSNNRTRHRDHKRKKYINFVNYLSEINQTSSVYVKMRYNYFDVLQKLIDYKLIDKSELDYKLNVIHTTEALNALKSFKLNGDYISKLTGLTGKNLGEFIKFLRNNTTIYDDVLVTDDYTLQKDIERQLNNILHLYF